MTHENDNISDSYSTERLITLRTIASGVVFVSKVATTVLLADILRRGTLTSEAGIVLVLIAIAVLLAEYIRGRIDVEL
jgi:hypothetical protein